ncbi:MAG: Polyribonucleotide nucleotidyltransferase [Parcubacteria group bacterium GW2011_GWC1_43_61]|nr:MAG: Polyribonucleotide nucleotidyltransferase [Candidatus Azambacteria bacterium GW2011_GWF1_41_10]KKS49418.1 MAG: Polyribonucleotide nucleotidyltransferase [Candidatus Azambacteria bacterium GW2011_GWF2_42_22]KKS69739.1 MAG: Polyribonucleotide nucleotidyltransferase [Candidatus Azambacteria bacterium GW2011_GWA2_42_62]KKT03529.1 MAG: Polyribonucleotide nucleotidyltransferase [Candidatus Azambacteria bacterium GW2011_GWD1_43_18]KKT12557.1 MAG: Polyribonucleotide nucleotidyltransferase [Cand
MKEIKKYSVDFAGQILEIEIGKLAGQANGAVTARLGDTVVLATAVMAKEPRIGGDFFPLSVDYEEKFYARGKILGSRFMRREGRPSEEAVLNARLIDRAIRPLFNQSARNEVQIVTTVLSVDEKNDPDILAMNAASMALITSDIPWSGPIAAIRIGKINGQWMLNPAFADRENGISDLVVSVSSDMKINMIEAGPLQELKEEELVEGIGFAQAALKNLIDFNKKIAGDFNTPKAIVAVADTDSDLRDEVAKFLNADNALEKAIYDYSRDKTERENNLGSLKDLLKEHIAGIDEKKVRMAEIIFDEAIDEIVHKNILEKDKRPDGRKMDELRNLSSEVGFLPRTHGSGLFQRGETQILSALTLGSPSDELIIEGMIISTKKHFMHQYNFPPFSVGETGRMGAPGRREIGHGALAEKALLPMIPKKEDFPYAIRIVSEVLSSNGSSSMGSVCGSTLALMDAGVPITKPVAGIAMGLMSNKKGDYKILTDIQGPEDHHGDMDFKAAGTKDGITAMQMDVKINGIDIKILKETLEQTRKARLEILDNITKTIDKPRANLSPFAPRIITLQIAVDKIREVIGSGGKVINEIIATTGAAIDIEESGLIFITAENEESGLKTKEIIEGIVKEYKVGEIVTGKVVNILDFGAIVEFGRGRDGMIHISELANRRVEKVTDVVNMGDEVTVKIKRVENGKISLSLKDAGTK